MAAEASSFETSEMHATFLASTGLLSESWRLCDLANTTAPQSLVVEQIGNVGYVAFSGIQTVGRGESESEFRNLVALDSAGSGLFSPLYRTIEGEEPVKVHAGFLHLFLTAYYDQNFQNQILNIFKNSKSIVITGHSIGATTASLSALWLLTYFKSISSSISVLCITFGSPLLGNASLSRAILREKWGGKFCHVVSKHDILPRLLFAPLASLTPQLHHIVQFWQLSMTSPQFRKLAVQLRDEEKAEIFRFVLVYTKAAAQGGDGLVERSLYSPFGNYLLSSKEGAICVENATSVMKMLHLMLLTGSPSCSIEDHLNYGDYVGNVSKQFLNNRSFQQDDLPGSSYEAGVALALESSGIANKDLVAIPAKDCLNMARRMGLAPNLKAANLAIKLSMITPYRAELEWYKTSCDKSDDQLGYYDSFKLRGSTKRDSKVNMNRHKLATFWSNVIDMLENNQLPHDFDQRDKWVNASQFYKLLVEPLDIAEYYRTGMQSEKGHYMTNGREKRYEIFDRWWKERHGGDEESNTRSRYASLTQDSCFWAKMEEAREWLDNVRSESDAMKLRLLWENIDNFERYARKLIESKEVSIDVLLKNSSYSLWVDGLRELTSQVRQFPPHFPSFLDGEIVP